jgi:hypothetical protein
VLARVRLLEGRLPREGISGRESVVSFTGGFVEAVLAAPQLTRVSVSGPSRWETAKANVPTGRAEGLRQGCQRFDRSVRGGQRTPTIPKPSGPPKRSTRRETRLIPGLVGLGTGSAKSATGPSTSRPSARAVTNREPTRRECSQLDVMGGRSRSDASLPCPGPNL